MWARNEVNRDLCFRKKKNTRVSAVEQHKRPGSALQESTEALQSLCCRQVDLIQQDPLALLHGLGQGTLKRNTLAVQRRSSIEMLTGCIRMLHLNKGEDHGRLTGSDLLLSLAQLNGQSLPALLQQGSCTHNTTVFQTPGLTFRRWAHPDTHRRTSPAARWQAPTCRRGP